MRFGCEVFARLCYSDSKDQIRDVKIEKLHSEAPNHKMQLLFGQLGAVSLISSLIQTLQSVWKVRFLNFYSSDFKLCLIFMQGDSSRKHRVLPEYPADVAQVLEDAAKTALTAFVCLCSGCPENKQSVSPDMLELLSEALLPIPVRSFFF